MPEYITYTRLLEKADVNPDDFVAYDADVYNRYFAEAVNQALLPFVLSAAPLSSPTESDVSSEDEEIYIFYDAQVIIITNVRQSHMISSSPPLSHPTSAFDSDEVTYYESPTSMQTRSSSPTLSVYSSCFDLTERPQQPDVFIRSNSPSAVLSSTLNSTPKQIVTIMVDDNVVAVNLTSTDAINVEWRLHHLPTDSVIWVLEQCDNTSDFDLWDRTLVTAEEQEEIHSYHLRGRSSTDPS